jgi:hypothetical protein
MNTQKVLPPDTDLRTHKIAQLASAHKLEEKCITRLYFYDIEYALENIIWFLGWTGVAAVTVCHGTFLTRTRSQIKPITTFHIWKSHYHKQTRESERLITEIAMRKIVHNNKIAWPNSFMCYYITPPPICVRAWHKNAHTDRRLI